MAGPLADGLGRKKGMFVANIVVIVGSVVQAAAFHRRDIIVGRVILGVGSVLLGPSAQSYTVEISHPAYRGVMMGLYNGCYFIGAIVSTCASTPLKRRSGCLLQCRAHIRHRQRHQRRNQLENPNGYTRDTMYHCPCFRMVPARIPEMARESRKSE